MEHIYGKEPRATGSTKTARVAKRLKGTSMDKSMWAASATHRIRANTLSGRLHRAAVHDRNTHIKDAIRTATAEGAASGLSGIQKQLRKFIIKKGGKRGHHEAITDVD